jgi:hypothetical protein
MQRESKLAAGGPTAGSPTADLARSAADAGTGPALLVEEEVVETPAASLSAEEAAAVKASVFSSPLLGHEVNNMLPRSRRYRDAK